MQRLTKYIGIALFLMLMLSGTSFGKSSVKVNMFSDSLEVITQYSLFSEYYKNKDYKSALPFGWKVLKLDPAKFSKWIYYKMEDALWYTHDSTNASPEKQKTILDTTLYLYNLAEKYYPADKAYWQERKAFVLETWANAPADTVIAAYEKAYEYDPNLSTYYLNRLGILYKDNASDNNDYKSKAIDLYSKLSEREPDNPQWPAELEGLVDNIEELVQIAKKTWDLDKDNLAKAWKYASLAMKAQDYKAAIDALNFLVDKSPNTPNYWYQLATAYQKTDQLEKAEGAFKKLIELDPQKKEYYLNLGIVYKDRNMYSQARAMYEKASQVGDNWGLPIMYLGQLYEQAARSCTFNFEAKLVYQLAVETYRRAKSMDPSLSQAAERISALSNAVPTKEDYFFRNYKPGDTIPITGECFSWINRSVTVPK